MKRAAAFWALCLLLGVPLDALGYCVRGKFVIAVDVGHSKNKSGAISSRGKEEFYFNQNIAWLLFKELTSNGFHGAFLINSDGDDISLVERTNIANKKKANLFLSIHHDSVQPRYLSKWNYQGRELSYCDLFNGYSLFYSEKNANPKDSLTISHAIGSALQNNLFVPTLHHAEDIEGENRRLVDREKGVYQFDELIVLKTAKMPAVLLECGIIVNRCEEILLSNPVYQKMLVMSVVQAMKKVCEDMEPSQAHPSREMRQH